MIDKNELYGEVTKCVFRWKKHWSDGKSVQRLFSTGIPIDTKDLIDENTA